MAFLKTKSGMAVIALAASLVLALVWLLLAPSAVSARLADELMRRTGRSLTVATTRLSLLPQPAVVLKGARLASAAGMEGALLSAETVRVPVSLGGLLTRRFRVENIMIDGAALALSIDGKGRTSFANSEATGDNAAAPDSPDAPRRHKPLHIDFSNTSVSFADARSGNRFAAANGVGSFDFNTAGEVNVQGTATVGGEAAAYTVYLADLARLADDGSPFDFTLRGLGGAFTYTGRLSTRTTLNLAGQASLDSADLRRTLSWLGLPVSGTAGLKDVKAHGAVAAEGASFTFKDLALAMDGMSAQGTASADFSGEKPMLRARLAMETLDVTPHVLRSGDDPLPAGKGDATPAAAWSEQFWDASGLAALNAEVAVAARRLVLGQLTMGPAEVSATLSNGRLTATVTTQGLEGGTGTITTKLDGTGPLPHLDLDLDLKGVAAEGFLPKLLGFDWLAGPLAVSARLSADGNSQARLISTLSGTADLSLSDGRIIGIDLDRLAATVVAAVSDGWGIEPERMTALSRASAHFTLRDGIAASDDIKLAGTGLSVAAQGDIDILRRAVNLAARPSLTGGGGDRKLPVAVTLAGPWDGPKISADTAGTLHDLGVDKRDVKKALKAGKKILKSITGN